MKNKRPSNISALCIISESELTTIVENYSCEFENSGKEFLDILFSLGLDISRPFQRQDGLTHRNRFNEIVICSRWVGQERIDDDWIKSGYASKEAIDKADGSKMLEDLYRSKNLTEDAQAMLESRDRYNSKTEE